MGKGLQKFKIMNSNNSNVLGAELNLSNKTKARGMMLPCIFLLVLNFYFGPIIAQSSAEMLAILNYESKAPESLEALQLQAGGEGRREGIAIIELDPLSLDYGNILIDIPVSPELVLHHIFYNKDLTKAYITALSSINMYVIDLEKFPYRLKPIAMPDCKVQENIIFSDDNTTWYVTCMGSENVVIGDAISDVAIDVVKMPKTYPHGIALHEGIDRLIVASCVAPDFSGVGNTIEVIEASTHKHIGSIVVGEAEDSAPVETVFVPNSNPPAAYVTNMMEDSLWVIVWAASDERFVAHKAFDFRSVGAQVPLEIYFNKEVNKLYVTTADPGMFHIFDISNGVERPSLITSLPTAGGSHHVAFSPSEEKAYVQNALLNLPGMNDGSITVINLESLEVEGSIDTFKDLGLAPNSITMLPKWYHPAGHFNNGPYPD